jgi:hypothetical protein
MSHEKDLFHPAESEKPVVDPHEDVPVSRPEGCLNEGDTPRERDVRANGHAPKKSASKGFSGDAFTYTEGEAEDGSDPVDIYAEPSELYEDADEDEILDAEEEITEETVEEAIEDAIEEVEADIEEEEEILAEQ